MIYVFYFFAVVLIWLSYRSYRGGIIYERFIRDGVSLETRTDLPFATIFAPCRGVDREFKQNLRRLFAQQYPSYEILFIVDDKEDAAVKEIEDAILVHSSDKVRARLLIAPRASISSQKIENLLFAIPTADTRSEVFAFVDSDACTDSEWLASLAAAALIQSVGAATGYRWLISESGKLGSELSSAWNGSVASALGRLDIESCWKGVLSDDFAVTKAVQDACLELEFVPRALCASFEHQTLGEMLEFTTRQMKITRVYSPGLWLLSMFGSTLFCSVMIASIGILLTSELGGLPMAAAIITLALVTVFTLAKAFIRLRAVRFTLSDHETLLAKQVIPQCVLAFVTPPIFLVNTILALFSRRIRWRGTVYELKSPSDTVIIREKR